MKQGTLSIVEDKWTRVGRVDDIPRRGSRMVNTREQKIALFRAADDRIFALRDECPHQKGPLSQGIVHDGCVTCPLHNWVISLETGEVVGVDEGAVPAFPVLVEDDNVFLDLTHSDK